jgi:streptogramin lyase
MRRLGAALVASCFVGLAACSLGTPSGPGGKGSPSFRATRTTTGSPSAFSSGFAIAARIHVPSPVDVVAAFGSVWVRSYLGFLWQIDPSSDRVVARIDVGGTEAVPAMAAGEGSLWLLANNGAVLRLNPSSDQVIARIPLASSRNFLAVGQGAVWVCGSGNAPRQGALYRIDPSTNRVVAQTMIGGCGSVAVSAGGVWVINGRGKVLHIDPGSARVIAAIRLGYPSLADVVVDRQWVFVTARSGFEGGRGGIVKINPHTNQVVARIPLPGALMGVTTGAGDVWVNSGPLVVVQPLADNVVATVPVSPPTDASAGIAVVGTSVWLADPTHQQVVRVDRR